LLPGRQALLVLEHLRCGDTYACWPPASGSGPAPRTDRCREAVDLLARLASTPHEAFDVARAEAFAILEPSR